MSKPKLTLNIRNPTNRKSGDNLAKAAEKKRSNIETMDEAWVRIFDMKNSAADERRLREVKQAMDEGLIGRDPDDMYNARGNLKRFSKAEALRLHRRLTEIRREDTLKELVESTPSNYVLVDVPAKLDVLISDIEASDLIAFDLETYSDVKGGALDPWVGKVAGFSVTSNGNNYYIPLNHTERPMSLSDVEIVECLKPSLEKAKSVMHNAPFDCKWFYLHYGVDMITNLHADTRIMAMALDENRSHRLKDLLTDWLRQPADNFDELFPDTDKFNEIPLDVALVYAAGDTEKTLQLYEWIKAKVEPYNLERIWKLLFEIEMPVAKRFIWSDLRGIGFDKDASYELDAKLEKEEQELERRIFDIFGEEINLNSHVQKGEMLYEKLRLTDLSGKKSTNQKFLNRIKGEHEVVGMLLEHSEIGKLRTSFTQSLPRAVKDDGRIHPWHNTYGAATGRFTCRQPNTQQIPARRSEVRKLFTALGDDRILVAMDYSQIELRVLAHLADDEVLIDAFKNGRDIHATTASLVSGIPYEQIMIRKNVSGSAEELAREQAKTVNFGIVYGMTEKALSDNLRITEREAKKIIDDYFAGYPGIKRYMDEQRRNVRKRGYVEDMYGRKRRFHKEMRSQQFWLRSAAERQAGNFPIQSSAGSMLKHAIVLLEKVLPKYDVNIALQVHDELIFDCPKDISFEALAEIQQTLENVIELSVPVHCDIDLYPERWSEGVSLDDWFNNKEDGHL